MGGEGASSGDGEWGVEAEGDGAELLWVGDQRVGGEGLGLIGEGGGEKGSVLGADGELLPAGGVSEILLLELEGGVRAEVSVEAVEGRGLNLDDLAGGESGAGVANEEG